VGGDHLGDGVFEGVDAFGGDGGDLVEGELATESRPISPKPVRE
jgi:hypothetical protein